MTAKTSIAKPRSCAAPKPLPSILALSGLALAAAFAAKPVQASEEKALVFGVVPQQSATRLAQVWVPFLAQLSKETGIKLSFATAKDIPTFEACLAKGAYDLSYMNPYHYTVFHGADGYQAFARQANKRLKGVVVVKKDSTIQSLEDLKKASIAFPSPAAFGASVIPRAEMKQRELDIKPVYVRSHDSVYRSVVSGLFPAGGGVMRTLGNVPERLRNQLRILYKTEGYTPHAFAFHQRVSQEAIKKITATMAGMTIEADPVLKPLGMKAFEAAKNSDWDDVRSLNLKSNHTEIITDDSLKCHSG